MSKIIYTKTDEAPALATESLLPIIKSFIKKSGIIIETKDISLAGRILSRFPEYIDKEKKITDELSELGELVKKPEANIIKLPNISASVPQLKAAIKELKKCGFNIPNYPEEPSNDEEHEIKSRYDKIKGSAVNPVLREGNSDRRAPKSVKEYARRNPHSMGVWNASSKTHVSTMSSGDFKANEQSITISKEGKIKIQHKNYQGEINVLKDEINVLKDEIIDGTFMSKKELIKFLTSEIENAKKNDLLFSLHMKATMMKISDPIIFGHAVRCFFKDLFNKHKKTIEKIGVDVNNGFGNFLNNLKKLNKIEQSKIQKDITEAYKNGPKLAMVDSEKGITNLHVPSDIIIDASMPAMIRSSGKMWNDKGKLQDTKAVIPDSSYAPIYKATIDFCKKNGAFNPSTMGTVPNIGLMAQKAEEYGSHDKTFEIASNGIIEVLDEEGNILISHNVEKGDIWRMCQVKHEPIKNWIELAIERGKITNTPIVFWLDKKRSHDFELIKKVENILPRYNTEGLNIQILSPFNATNFTLNRIKEGKDTISVTGNVLRDYLTDLFPILELGTSAKMLSIVPLINGGGLFETGAGGSAPKHVQQFNDEGHLRWDSLGEFLALAVSLEHISKSTKNKKASILATTLEDATVKFLLNDKSPSRKVGELDNRGSHFYIAKYWAESLANQSEDTELKNIFSKISIDLNNNENIIVNELNNAQGKPINLGGYYFPNPEKVSKAMRSSKTFNNILKKI